MSTSAVFLVLAAFLASAVEMVEALTIVLAVGVTRGWRSTLIGVGVATVALAAVVAALGPALVLIPIAWLRLVVGALLLIFGLQWLRKAIMRASGYKALHDEDATYREELEAAREAGRVVRAGMDWYSFTLSFKGVFLEGLEVAFIVLTFGSAFSENGATHATSKGIILATVGAVAALVIVGGVGLAVHAPLSRVPENTMKFAVGVMLTTFGIFWGVEGARGAGRAKDVNVDWPGREGAILALLAFIILLSFGLVALLKQQHARTVTATPAVRGAGD
ncbi:MAG: COG4280 domain-containing protein [Thermomicrobiales bacterium]